MTATETAKAMREFLKQRGIKARVHAGARKDCVYVETPTFEAEFSAEQQAAFANEAIRLGLTHSHGLPIRPTDGTYTKGAVFYLA